MMNIYAVVKKIGIDMQKRMYKNTKEIFLQRFVIKENGCWEWTSVKDKDGYGLFPINGFILKAHRYSYKIHNKRFDEEKFVLHKCDNPPCVNPKHLYQGTATDNNRDTVKRGRYKNMNTIKTHCKNGHEFSKENLYKSRSVKSRICHKCKKARAVEYLRRKRMAMVP